MLAAVAALALPDPAHGAAGVRTDGSGLPAGRIPALPAVVYAAHRGGALEGRENALSGFQRAFDSGVVDVLDTDIRRLASGQLVVMHDPTVARTTTSTGRVSSLTLTQWHGLRLDIGSWLKPPPPSGEAPPTLAELLDQFGGKIVLTIEVKDGAVDDVADLLAKKGLVDSVFVNTNDPDVARHIHAAGLNTQLWRSATQMHTDHPREFKPYVDLLDVDAAAPKADIKRFVASGVRRVWAHTVTTRAEAGRVIRLGVDGIVTDDPRYVTGVTDTFPESPTLLHVIKHPSRTQVSDHTMMAAGVSTSSGAALPGANVIVHRAGVSSQTVGTVGSNVRTLRLTTMNADKGRHALTVDVPAEAGKERRWPAASTRVEIRLAAEDLELRPRVSTDGRQLKVRVKLLDSAAKGYAGANPERGADRTVAGLQRARLRLQVRHGGVTLHKQWVHGADTGVDGNGSGSATFSTWTAPQPGWYRIRIVQRGGVYRTLTVERKVRLG